MYQVMGETVQPIHQDREQAVPATWWSFLSVIECTYVLGGKGNLGNRSAATPCTTLSGQDSG